jgi:hypothetical protein
MVSYQSNSTHSERWLCTAGCEENQHIVHWIILVDKHYSAHSWIVRCFTCISKQQAGKHNLQCSGLKHNVNYSKIVKEHCPADSVSVVQPSRCFALVHPNPGYYWVSSGQCWQSRLQCFTCHASFCQKLAMAKMLWQQKPVTIFHLWAFLTLCHTLQSCTHSTPSHYNQGWSLLCACFQF